MNMEKDDLATKFLLGKLTEEENIKIEESYFSDKHLFEEILIAENDLIDAYAADSLSSEDKNRFESRLLLNQNQRQRVRFAKTLVNYASSQPLMTEEFSSTVKSSWTSNISQLIFNKPTLSFAFTAAVILLFVGGIWLTLDRFNPQINQTDELAVIQTPQEIEELKTPVEDGNSNQILNESKQEISTPPPKSNRQKTPQVKQEMPQKKKSPVIFSLILSSGLTRDVGTSQRFTIPAKTDFVRMRLKFEEDEFTSYSAILETVEGNQVWRSNRLTPKKDGKFVEVIISSKFLKNSDYILSLKGITKEGVYERVEDYTFTINR